MNYASTTSLVTDSVSSLGVSVIAILSGFLVIATGYLVFKFGWNSVRGAIGESTGSLFGGGGSWEYDDYDVDFGYSLYNKKTRQSRYTRNESDMMSDNVYYNLNKKVKYRDAPLSL